MFCILILFFGKKGSVNAESIKLTNDFEMNALKAECVEKEILNSFFLKMVKIPKMTQIHQKYIFLICFVICRNF
jgi:hypothetical protein